MYGTRLKKFSLEKKKQSRGFFLDQNFYGAELNNRECVTITFSVVYKKKLDASCGLNHLKEQ
jgi:hypothetical protein